MFSVCVGADLAAVQWHVTETGVTASLRGLSAVDDRVIWASGSDATVIRSTDGGQTWTSCGPTNHGDLELRCVHAFDDQHACIASAGTPAVLLRTVDGGMTWTETYRASSPAAFLDAMSFWDSKHGIAFSDPVEGKLLVVKTDDGGRSWTSVSDQLPEAREGEAAFAASNSSLCVGDSGRLWFGTGGAKSDSSRLYFRSEWNGQWSTASPPIPSSSTSGIFSITTLKPQKKHPQSSIVICVGGDYRVSEPSPVTGCISHDGGVSWRVMQTQPGGFRSALIVTPPNSVLSGNLIAVGPEGTDISNDGDLWRAIASTGFHALAIGDTEVFACGSEGRFGRLTLANP
ncbi:WD40/YVTN/BNR-like repeat-containing protein [Rhodopirellula halodulae]|uniref:WD40/YVTN/BNR-like repeat-containing protein n=1 Tax=Rhodopirellula halodulae TaxID=2894198 RepID=UPI001E35395D|nr:oxidoreductase [Rhodopirellula sp. JC737]MCC9656382.1 oxidoreductase [Rhodopirellula sp. JC737]